ncbi:flagellar type III secretion system pore protein FliP [Microbacterium sp. APC 3901]|uniref:flagellar type III secretion system pore protein FliP n=1 Tax=Microbacterium sp. APC 3901 TaxID=3035192 RepID=UPI0025B2A93C|nr:flagellar type III secretion system pore protein FliP [Microbacterium sp. APC 3901]MDN3443820.1 flagellar type III secretion system pore protein FliP [Microbacterium sp. APC 3901]
MPVPAAVAASPSARAPRLSRRAWVILGAVLVVATALVLLQTAGAQAATMLLPSQIGDGDGDSVTINGINGINGAPSDSIMTLLGITVLSVAPALLLMMSSFTKIFVVLALTRNALSLPSIPPNQVLAGLSLFLTLFIMWPVLTDINTVAVAPFTDGRIDFGRAFELAQEPLRQWMLTYTREEDIALMHRAAQMENPTDAASIPLQTLVPAFMISELRAAFLIGFIIFVPFLVIDLVVASALMSMGMMMLPPVMISLPFKILLFLLIDGWGMVITALVQSYNGGG